MRKIKKRDRLTVCAVLDIVYFPFSILESIVESYSSILVFLTIIITVVKYLRGAPIGSLYIGIAILALVYVVMPLNKDRILMIYLYVTFYRVILDVEAVSLDCFFISVSGAFCFAVLYGIFNLYHIRLIKRILPVLMIIVILGYSFNTIIKSVIFNYGDTRVERCVIVSSEIYRQAHYLTIEIEDADEPVELHVTKEVYEESVKDGALEVVVYKKWGIQVCREKARTGRFDA